MTHEKAIADYAMIGDCHSAALINLEGSVDWWCVPRFDSPSIFGSLLGQGAGFFQIVPIEPARVSRAYLRDSLVLESTYETPSGCVVVTDALALGPGESGHEIGFSSPHILLRTLRCTRGRVAMRMRLAARPEYGAIGPVVTRIRGGAIVRGGAERLVLSTSEDLCIEGNDVTSTFVSLSTRRERHVRRRSDEFVGKNAVVRILSHDIGSLTRDAARLAHLVAAPSALRGRVSR